MTLFKTDSDLKIEFQLGTQLFSHLVSQPTLEHLKKIENNYPEILSTDFRGEFDSPDLSTKRNIFLWEMLVKEVSGYGLEQDKDWKEKIPTMHKIMIAKELCKVKSIDASDVLLHFGHDQVEQLSYEYVPIYTVADQAGNTLLQIHIFKQPSESDIYQYNRVTAYSHKFRKNKIKMKSKPQTDFLNDGYDKLIYQVKGYSSTANPTTTTNETLVPPLHKIVAIRALFNMLNEDLETQLGNS